MKTEQTGTPYTVDQMIEAIQLVMTERDRLKAANAEMLKLLHDINQWFTVQLKRGTINAGTANRDGDLVSQIRAAIAKAETL